MSDFLKFVKKEQQKKLSEEEQLELHKKQKLTEATYNVDDLDDDGFYDEEEIEEEPEQRIVEAHRIPRRQNPVPRPQPVRQPVEPTYDEPYEEPEEPAPVPQRRTRRTNISEQYDMPQMNPVLSEAYSLIDEMKNKMETMFFKYGMTGLQRLNECMLDMCDEIMNPPARPYNDVDEDPYIEERVLTKKKPVAAKTPVRKPVKKATVVASKPRIVKSEEAVLKEKAQKMNNMLETADLSELGNTLVNQSKVQVNKGAERKAQIEARAKALDEKLTKENVQENQEIPEEDNTSVEPLEVVPDGSTTIEIEEFDENGQPVKNNTEENTTLENINNNTAENNEEE